AGWGCRPTWTPTRWPGASSGGGSSGVRPASRRALPRATRSPRSTPSSTTCRKRRLPKPESCEGRRPRSATGARPSIPTGRPARAEPTGPRSRDCSDSHTSGCPTRCPRRRSLLEERLRPTPPEMDLVPALGLVGLLLVKEAGIPIPVPGDLLVIGAGVAAAGTGIGALILLLAILAAGYVGGTLQFLLVRGAFRGVLLGILRRAGVP